MFVGKAMLRALYMRIVLWQVIDMGLERHRIPVIVDGAKKVVVFTFQDP